MDNIKIGIAGYGNLGKGVRQALQDIEDLELEAVFTRRNPEDLDTSGDDFTAEHVSSARDYVDRIDVMLLCGGSASDLPEQGPKFAEMFNTVDSYDNHGQIPEYYASIDQAASRGAKAALISIGWDPGLFSLNRMLMESVLPGGRGYTFWGPGVSQGHSDAVRRIEGVEDAVQYTIPREEAIEEVRGGNQPELSTGQKHLRRCFVVAGKNADCEQITREIKNMPGYFDDYETEVNFITQKQLHEEHSAMPHGGFVMHSARTGRDQENSQLMEFSLKLDSNPEFTARVLTAYARGIYRMYQEGKTGAFTIYDIPPAYITPRSGENLRENML